MESSENYQKQTMGKCEATKMVRKQCVRALDRRVAMRCTSEWDGDMTVESRETLPKEGLPLIRHRWSCHSKKQQQQASRWEGTRRPHQRKRKIRGMADSTSCPP